MPPALNDNEGTDLKAWLASIPSFASDWPRGVLCADLDAPCIDTKPAPCVNVLSHGGKE